MNIALVPVGNPGNVADPLTGYGAVSYSYSIGEYDVTMGQYYGLFERRGHDQRPLRAVDTQHVKRNPYLRNHADRARAASSATRPRGIARTYR